MGSQMSINAVIEQAMGGYLFVQGEGQVGYQIAQTNMLFTRDRSATFAGTPFQTAGLSRKPKRQFYTW